MKKLSLIVLAVMCANSAFADVGDLSAAISRVRVACFGISDSMSGLKTRAGINTALTGVGTAAGGVALGVGIAKANVDKDLKDIFASIQQAAENQGQYENISDSGGEQDENSAAQYDAIKANIKRKPELEQKSKTLGKIRTGTMAGAAVTDTIGTVLAAKNQVDDDLDNRIQECKSAVGGLSGERLRARAENTATVEELERANNIVSACSEWENADLSKIDKRGKGAAISSGTGAVLALAGTITSAKANKQSALDKDYNKGLDTTSNVLAGGTTAASLTATIFNATQISAIKKAVNAADKCEEALK